MTIDETAELLFTELSKNTKTSSDLLYRVKVSTDPYENIDSETLPLVLIESDTTDFENAEQGYPVRQEHKITLTCIVSAQDISRKTYKAAVNNLVKNTIDKMMKIVHDDIQVIKPMGLSHSELLIGSLKVSAVIVDVRIKTYWEDL